MDSYRELKNKPLVEAIFEIRWALQQEGDTLSDPFFPLLVGSFHDKIKEKFPFWNKLPPAEMPPQITPYMAHHQFRKVENGWPLIQIGPGLLTVNDTDGYLWENFHKFCIEAIEVLFTTYPEAEESLKIIFVNLRYIDADYLEDLDPNAFAQKLKVNISVPESLFEDDNVISPPLNLKLQLDYKTKIPTGITRIKISSGQKQSRDAIIWETGVISINEDVPSFPGKCTEWLSDAHSITHNWFFELTKGELLEKYL